MTSLYVIMARRVRGAGKRIWISAGEKARGKRKKAERVSSPKKLKKIRGSVLRTVAGTPSSSPIQWTRINSAR